MMSAEELCAHLEELRAWQSMLTHLVGTVRQTAPKHLQPALSSIEGNARLVVDEISDLLTRQQQRRTATGCTVVVVRDGYAKHCGEPVVKRREETRWCAEHAKGAKP